MATLTVRKHLEAEPDRVFALATDFPRAPEVLRGVLRVEMLTAGPVGAGTRFREARIVLDQEIVQEMQLTEFEPPHRYTLSCEHLGTRYLTRVLLQPNGGGTDVEMRFEAEPLTMMAKAMAGMIEPMLKHVAQLLEADLDDLEHAVSLR